MYENIILEKRGHVAIVTINRPDKLNALNIPTRTEIVKVLEELKYDNDTRVVVFTGAGEKSFIAGADISEFEGRTVVDQIRAMTERNAFQAVGDFPKPVIAMINGFCLGGGCELALACDIRIASEKARFGQPEINLGIIPGGGGTQRLAHLVSEGMAMQMILTGDMITAPQAKEIGLVNEVVAPDQLEARTLELANKIAEKSPIALQMAKESVKNAHRMNLREGLEMEIQRFCICFSSEDKEEGVRAFLEKRKPEFKGK